MATRRQAAPRGKQTHRGWILLAVAIGIAVLGGVLGRNALPVLVIAVLATAALGIVVAVKGTVPRLGMRSRKSGFAALGAAVLLLIGGAGGAGNGVVPEDGDSATALRVAAPKLSSVPQATRPSPRPTTFEEVHLDTAIPFERQTVDDPTVAEGTSTITTAGVAGTRRETYRVTYVDGKEISRELVGESVVVEPITEVTTRGTMKSAPAPAPRPVPLTQPNAGCDSNYAGACVPVASDVDCAGGSGNGPKYLSGQAQVVGSDIYDLDRDNDGIACN